MLLIFGTDLSLAAQTADQQYALTMPCKAHSVPGVQYRKISWYKVIGSEYVGLVMKNLRSNESTVYRGANHSYVVGEEFSLLMPESALGDCGTYQCTLWPPLGQYIQEGQYQYYPAGCVRPTEPLPIIPLTEAPPSCCDISRNLAAWGVPAALLIFIITVGTVSSLCHRPKKYKLADTI